MTLDVAIIMLLLDIALIELFIVLKLIELLLEQILLSYCTHTIGQYSTVQSTV